jgi:anti-sigma B factor antagonist
MDEFKVESLPGLSNDVLILRLSGPFTVRGIFDFRESVLSGNNPVTVIDLTGVPYMDSAALGEIIRVHTSSLRQQRRYALVGASERLHNLFRVAGVHQILVMYPTLEEAEQKLFSKNPGN